MGTRWLQAIALTLFILAVGALAGCASDGSGAGTPKKGDDWYEKRPPGWVPFSA